MTDYRNILRSPCCFLCRFHAWSVKQQNNFQPFAYDFNKSPPPRLVSLAKSETNKRKKINEIPYFDFNSNWCTSEVINLPPSLFLLWPETNNMLVCGAKHDSRHSFAHNERSPLKFEGVSELLGIDSCLDSRYYPKRFRYSFDGKRAVNQGHISRSHTTTSATLWSCDLFIAGAHKIFSELWNLKDREISN